MEEASIERVTKEDKIDKDQVDLCCLWEMSSQDLNNWNFNTPNLDFKKFEKIDKILSNFKIVISQKFFMTRNNKSPISFQKA